MGLLLPGSPGVSSAQQQLSRQTHACLVIRPAATTSQVRPAPPKITSSVRPSLSLVQLGQHSKFSLSSKSDNTQRCWTDLDLEELRHCRWGADRDSTSGNHLVPSWHRNLCTPHRPAAPTSNSPQKSCMRRAHRHRDRPARRDSWETPSATAREGTEILGFSQHAKWASSENEVQGSTQLSDGRVLSTR